MRFSISRKIIGLLVLLAGFLTVHTMQAKAQTGQDDARAVITNQLESFLAGDFEQAYSYASPTIKDLFPTLDRFMAMVKGGYLPVLSPGNYAYGETVQLNGERLRQDVLIRAPDGSDWTATYFMEMQADGTWKVDGVSLRKGAAGMT